MSDMMDHQHPGNLLVEGASHGAARAGELAGLLMMAAQHAARAREQRLQAELANSQQEADAQRAQLRADHAADRLRWAPALERDFAAGATAHEAMGAWTAAQPWVEHDPSAAQAANRAEERLAVLHPDLMEEYRGYRADDMEPTQAMLEAGRTVSAPAWRGVLDPSTRQDMGVDDTLRAWNAARPWAAQAPQAEGLWSPRSEEAAQAMGEAEAHLRGLRPAAMADYDDARARGVDSLEAMQGVAPQLGERVWESDRVERDALDPGGAQAAQTLAVEERGEAVRDFATPDQPATRDVDEHTVAARAGVEHEEVFEASSARAASLASQSYPQTVHVALATPTGAAPVAAGARVAQQAPGRHR